MMTVAQLVVEVLANTKPGEEGMRRVNQEVEKSGGLFSHFAGFAGNALSSLAGFVGAGVIMQGLNLVMGAVTSTIGDVVNEAQNLSDAQALLNQRLLSTHDAVGLSAQAIEDMAQRMSDLSGVTKSTILQGDNMLLTFTGIGKDVFPQASQAMEDLAISMNHGQAAGADMQTAAIELGKALNDPEKGMTALMRVGVTFTQQQKDLVKQYMATGDVADAQRVILNELAKEFGGTAVAAGSTFGGALDKLKNIIVDFGANALLKIEAWAQPMLDAFAKWLPGAMDTAGKFFGYLGTIWSTQFLPPLQSITSALQFFARQALGPLVDMLQHSNLGALFSNIGSAAASIGNPLKTLADYLHSDTFGEGVFFPILKDLQNFGSIVQQQVLPVARQLSGWFQNTMLPAIASVQPAIENFAGFVITKVVPAFIQFEGYAAQTGGTIARLLLPVFEKIAPLVVKLGGFLLDLGQKALAFLLPYIVQAEKAISSFATEMSTRLQPFIEKLVSGIQVAADIISKVWTALWPFISAVLKEAWDLIANIVKTAWDILTGVFKIGADLLSGNWSQLWKDVQDLINGVVGDIEHTIVQWLGDLGNVIMQSPIGQFFANFIINPIKNAVQAAIGWIEGLWQAFIDWISGSGQKAPPVGTTGYGKGGGGARQSGGPVLSGLSYLVGEHGPEYFVPREHGQIVDTNKTQSLLQAGAPHVRGGDTINLYGPTSDQLLQQMTLHQQRQKALVLASVR